MECFRVIFKLRVVDTIYLVRLCPAIGSLLVDVERTWTSGVPSFKLAPVSVQNHGQRIMSTINQWNPGDWAVYRKSKRSTSPGPRAANIKAAQKGESYNYVVDKFWVVESVLPDNQIQLRTARGKTHVISIDDPNLRRPSWLQRLIYRDRFREAELAGQPHLVA